MSIFNGHKFPEFVLHCSECKYWLPCAAGNLHYCKKTQRLTKPNHYCGYAIRKDK